MSVSSETTASSERTSCRTKGSSTSSVVASSSSGTYTTRKCSKKPGASSRTAARRSSVHSPITRSSPRSRCGASSSATLALPWAERPVKASTGRSSTYSTSPRALSSVTISVSRCSHAPTTDMPAMMRLPSTCQTSVRSFTPV